jgi:hypothetical protein
MSFSSKAPSTGEARQLVENATMPLKRGGRILVGIALMLAA